VAEPLLHNRTLAVDPSRVGISYSGGGALLLVELGIAQAFVELGVVPYAISGVSAGAIAGAAHAVDPVHGEGIRLAAKGLERVSNRALGLTAGQVAIHAVRERQHLAALGSNEPIEGLLSTAFQEVAKRPRLTFGDFGRDGRPKLVVGAADRLRAEAVWFGPDVDVADALVASSAIPGVFPARWVVVAGERRLLVDGGIATNQPLSVLALEGCGTLYACAVGYDGERLKAPANLVDNVLQSLSISRHEASRLEQDYVQLQMGQHGAVHHIHPVVNFPVSGFDFDADVIARVMREASEATRRWITDNHLLPGGGGDA
jgi:NTE family protein